MGSAPSPPPTADPAGVAAGQFASNLAAGEAAQAGSQVNQVGPTGAVTYYQTGVGPDGVPTYTAINQLTPQQQQLLNEQQLGMGIAGGAGNNMLANSYGLYSQPANLSSMAGGATNQLMGLETSYLSPYFGQQTEQTDNTLRNQGIMPGTPAYNNQMLQLSNQQNNAVTGFLAQAEPQAFSQAVQQYSLPLQIGSTLMGMNQPGNVNLPETGQPPGYQSPNVIGAVANAQQSENQQYQSQMQQYSAMLSGMMGLGGNLLKLGMGGMGSDRRLKKDIKPFKFSEELGVWFYKWKYKSSDQEYIGPIAQELQEVRPDLVTEHHGYLMIPSYLVSVVDG